MLTRPLRVAIDARYLSHNLMGGVHTYLYNLASQLVQASGEQEIVLWIDDKAAFDLDNLGLEPNVRVIPWRTPLSSARNDQRLGLMMRRGGADVVHFPANYGFAPPGVPTVITLHDAINLMPLAEIIRGHSRDPKTVLTMSYLHLMTRRAIDRQPLVLTVSEHAKSQILRYAPLEPDRVRVVYSAPDSQFRVLEPGVTNETRERLQLRPRVLLADAIKNPETALMAFRLLPAHLRESVSLIFFARRPPSAAVRAAAVAGECLLLMRPSREELVRLYNLADLFIFPSWYEGFGLPVIESMACGTPVIASDRGSLPEIVGSGGLNIPPTNAEQYAMTIRDLLEDDERLRGLSHSALQHASRFSWERTGRETSTIYREAFELARSQTRRLLASASLS